ncbi:hypothetical protein PSTG_02404 [Puccinia striiformis f. sp. tritici PST-78]|uniref:Myosin motor domain-containing protein n=1 Tax=Puccinia striiformis f. sp. tritici PST-78 TaxID=1165861 RepID=A0A0L0VYY3_9BASI|nr:hypothetical protein PSTG_02404 [Puccinia striiformis f. sp. tritici PST-78]
MDSQDHSPARIEMLIGGLMGGKADSKPGGIIGGLGKTSNSHRNSSDSFVSRLLSGPLLALDRHPLDPSVLVAAQVSSSPLRRPSPILPTHPHISLEPGSPRGAPLDSTVALIDTSVVQPTLSPMFSMRFRLEGTEANDLRRQLSIGLMLEENQDFAIGRSRVWPTFRAFQSLEERLSAEQPAGSQQRPIAGHLAGFDIPGGSPQELDSGGDLGGGGSGSYSHLIPSGSGNGDDQPNLGYEAERNIPQSPGFGGEGQLHDAPHGGPMGYHDGPAQSRVWGSEWESKQPMEEQDMLSKEERYMDHQSISEPQATRYLHRSIDPTSYQPTQANSGYQRLICKSLSGRTCAELTPSSLPTCFECILLDQKDLGFSGSGKSTSLRLITNQFIKLSQNNSFGPSSQSSQALRLADQISHLFLLLNSFTTAKTFQNPSAFRLSTLLKLHFDNLLHLVGAKLLVFGLERNRLRIPLKSAHNQTFDVFYQLLAGIPSD